jgi:hypothetical protein
MPVVPIDQSAVGVDLSPRIQLTTSITGSPAAAAETIIATLNLVNFGNFSVVTGVDLTGWAAYTVGTNGAAVQFRIRQTNVAGSIVGNSGALTGSQHGAAILSADDCEGFDATPGVAVYVLTMQVTSGSATSTVSAVKLRAIIV